MRTEQDVLKDFEKLGYEIRIDKYCICMNGYLDVCIYIDFRDNTYSKCKYLESEDITIQEHKLLNELFTIWGWI